MPRKNPKLHVVAGPTASGKTKKAIDLALSIGPGTPIISFDSRQFYKELNIGVARPGPEELSQAPHYFIADRSILAGTYSAGQYGQDARELLQELFQEHEQIIAVGGSGLYLKALLKPLDHFPEIPSSVRIGLNRELKEKGLSALVHELQKKDPVYATMADLHNPARVIRALEVIRHSQKPFSSFQGKSAQDGIPFAVEYHLLDLPREELYRRINDRVDSMMHQGLLEEVHELLPLSHLPALQTVGYSELFAHLSGEWDLPTAVDKIKQHTRNYAKRQITWFRNQL